VIGAIAAVVALALVIGGMIALTSGGDDSGSSETDPATTSRIATSTAVSTTAEPTTTVEDTVPEIPVAELEAKLLSLAEVNDMVGGGFEEVEPGPPGDPLCGLPTYAPQTSAIRVFHNAETNARVASAIDRYPTESAAAEAFAADASLGTTCVDRNYTVDGIAYTVLIVPFHETIQDRCPDCIGVLVGYSPADPSTAQPIFQFVVETRDGANVIGSSYITWGREITQEEIASYIELYLLARNRAVS